jgi:hypothetical protein
MSNDASICIANDIIDLGSHAHCPFAVRSAYSVSHERLQALGWVEINSAHSGGGHCKQKLLKHSYVPTTTGDKPLTTWRAKH